MLALPPAIAKIMSGVHPGGYSKLILNDTFFKNSTTVGWLDQKYGGYYEWWMKDSDVKDVLYEAFKKGNGEMNAEFYQSLSDQLGLRWDADTIAGKPTVHMLHVDAEDARYRINEAIRVDVNEPIPGTNEYNLGNGYLPNGKEEFVTQNLPSADVSEIDITDEYLQEIAEEMEAEEQALLAQNEEITVSVVETQEVTEEHTQKQEVVDENGKVIESETKVETETHEETKETELTISE